VTKVLATVAHDFAASGSPPPVVATTGNGGTSPQRASVGGEPIETKSGQRVQALKLLEEPAADHIGQVHSAERADLQHPTKRVRAPLPIHART
jgi:hypothetical protein